MSWEPSKEGGKPVPRIPAGAVFGTVGKGKQPEIWLPNARSVARLQASGAVDWPDQGWIPGRLSHFWDEAEFGKGSVRGRDGQSVR